MTYDGRGLRFGTIAEQYDRLRPPPPPAALKVLGDVAGTSFVDVGAGTGLWTRFLHELGAVVTAVEPDDDMRRVLERRSPDIVALKGTAEQLPLEDDSFDSALVSSAWHWFGQPEASNEIGRVLHDDGVLYILRNSFNREVPWIAELADMRERSHEVGTRPPGGITELTTVGPFMQSPESVTEWTRTMSEDELVELFGTFSGTFVRPEKEREELATTLRRKIHAQARAGVVEVPMTLRCAIARRRPR